MKGKCEWANRMLRQSIIEKGYILLKNIVFDRWTNIITQTKSQVKNSTILTIFELGYDEKLDIEIM